MFQSLGAIISPFTKLIVYPSVLSLGTFLDGVRSIGVVIVPSESASKNNFGSNKFSCGALANGSVGRFLGVSINWEISVSITISNPCPFEKS